MKRLIIVEGPDCSGKTTLAKQIAVSLNYQYVHLSGHWSFHACMEKYHEVVTADIEWTIKNTRCGVVLDRCWISELIYAPVTRPSLVGHFDTRKFQQWIKSLGGIYILCMDSDVVRRHELEKDSDHPYDLETFHKVVHGYSNFMASVADDDDYLFYDMTQPNRAHELIDSIKRWH